MDSRYDRRTKADQVTGKTEALTLTRLPWELIAHRHLALAVPLFNACVGKFRLFVRRTPLLSCWRMSSGLQHYAMPGGQLITPFV